MGRLRSQPQEVNRELLGPGIPTAAEPNGSERNSFEQIESANRMNMGILDQIDFVKRYPNVPSVGATLLLLLLLLLAAVAIDYLQLLRKRRALQGIPIVGEGSYWHRRLSRPPIARDFKGVLQHGLDTVGVAIR